MREFLTKAGLVAVLAVIAVGANAFAATFAEPTGAPPTNNAEIPINVGAADQTKAGGFWANSFATANRYALGATSAWFVDAGKATVVAQQYCIGTDPTSAAGNTCVTSLSGGGGAACHLERVLIGHIPSSKFGYQVPYNDYCQAALSDASFPIKLSDQWTATGSDDCAEYLGDGDNCNGSHKGDLLQCTYVRMVCDGSPIAVSPATSRNY